jgi:hypothetical protein
MNLVKNAFRSVMSIVALMLALVVTQQFTLAIAADMPQFAAQSVASFTPSAIAPEATVSASEEPAEETVVQSLHHDSITVSATADPVDLVSEQSETVDENEAVAEFGSGDGQQQESEAVRKARQAVEDAQRKLLEAEEARKKLQQQEEEGKRVQESVKPSPPVPAQPIQDIPQPSIPGAETKQFAMTMPAMCEDLGLILGAIDKIKTEKAQISTQAVADFFADINTTHACGELVSKLSQYVDMKTVTPRPISGGPSTKEIITTPGDYRLAAYGIGYGEPFKRWSENRVAKKELRTLEDYIASEKVLLDHIQYFNWDAHPELKPKVEQMKAEMPAVLTGCLHESWRWSSDVKLCQWMDAAQVPYWVTTWATKTQWGLHYDLLQKRDAPMLVAYLPESQEYVFWAGPCGGNGGWLPSGSKAAWSVDVLSVDCDRVTGQPVHFTSDRQEGFYEALLGLQGKLIDRNKVELRNRKWTLENSQGSKVLSVDKESTMLIGQEISSSVPNKLTYTGESRMKVEGADITPGAWHPMTCSIQLTKELPPPVIPPQVVCDSIQAKLEKGRIRVTYKIQGDASLIQKTQITVDGNVVPENQVRLEKDGSLTFPDTITDTEEHHISVMIFGADGQPLGNPCNERTPGNTIRKQPKCAKCESAKESGKLKKGDTEQIITITPSISGDVSTVESAVWTDQNGKVVGNKYVNNQFELSFRAGDFLPTITNKGKTSLKSGDYKFTLTVKCKDGSITKCTVTIRVVGGNGWKWILLAVAVVAIVVAVIILTSGAGAPIATKVAIAVIGV